jgi:superfamily II DNA/RNA helicase
MCSCCWWGLLQVHADFEFYGNAVGLSTVCVYGGAPYGGQENAMRKGVDIVVGTPGRVKDFFERGTLNVKTLKFRVLDEADEMLNMGFVDDVELILGMVAHNGVALIHVLLYISLKFYTPTLRLHFLLIMFMGLFIDKVFYFLARTGGVDDVTQVQTLLFSATMPDWVKKVCFPSFMLLYQSADFVFSVVYNGYSVHSSPLLIYQLGQSVEDLSLLGV